MRRIFIKTNLNLFSGCAEFLPRHIQIWVIGGLDFNIRDFTLIIKRNSYETSFSSNY